MSAPLPRALALALALTAAALAAPGAAAAAAPPVIVHAQWTLRVTAGSPAGFIAEAVDPDGDAVTLTWTFDDGTTASGGRAVKVWTTPGLHTTRVTATDATGRRAVRHVTTEVLALGAAPSAPTAPPPAAARVPRPGPAPVARASIRVAALRLTAAGSVPVRVRCAPVVDCAGTIAVSRGGRRIAGARYAVAAGRARTVALRVPAATARALRRRPASQVAVVLTLAPDGGAATRSPRVLRTR